MAALVSTTQIPGLRLLEGERLLLEGKPLGTLRPAMLVAQTLVGLVTIVGIPFLPLIWWAALQSITMHRYWLTDRRVIVQTGVIGFQVRSIPLSRVSDVSVKANWFDRLFGLCHVEVRDMTGETGPNGQSKGVTMLAVSDPALWSEAILSRTGNGSVVDGDSQLGEVVSLLQKLVDRAA